MKLLIKIPTRERGLGFVRSYLENITNPDTVVWLTLDEDEWDNYGDIADSIGFPHELSVFWTVGNTASKIDAYNRDIVHITNQFDWDIIMVGSDDMWPNEKGFDQNIIDDMQQYFPDTDGALWYDTEDSLRELKHRYGRDFTWGSPKWQRKWISMLPIMGRKYYERFGYIYHPAYKSFFCDEEYTKVALKLQRIKAIPRTHIRHQHPDWGGGVQADDLYHRNNKNWKHDQTLYQQRKRQGFYEKI